MDFWYVESIFNVFIFHILKEFLMYWKDFWYTQCVFNTLIFIAFYSPLFFQTFNHLVNCHHPLAWNQWNGCRNVYLFGKRQNPEAADWGPCSGYQIYSQIPSGGQRVTRAAFRSPTGVSRCTGPEPSSAAFSGVHNTHLRDCPVCHTLPLSIGAQGGLIFRHL